MPAHDHEPSDEPLRLEDLPPPNTSRWVARRKAQVVAAVQSGLLSVDDACRTYRLTIEELASWQRALRQFGVRGLQVTRGRLNRIAPPSRAELASSLAGRGQVWMSRHA